MRNIEIDVLDSVRQSKHVGHIANRVYRAIDDTADFKLMHVVDSVIFINLINPSVKFPLERYLDKMCRMLR